MRELFIGIMSGTSLDGADAVLVDFSGRQPKSLGASSASFSPAFREDLLALCSPGKDGLDLAGRCAIDLARHYGEAAKRVMEHAGVDPGDVEAIGCHGQTVRHRPSEGFTIQLDNPALLAELTGIDVVADFRRRDMAAGGQGAPLVPLFHEAVFRHDHLHRVIVNIGGISNVTSLHPARRASGFDCGPGNLLMDGWIRTHRGEPFDSDGNWASTGRVIETLLARLRSTPFLSLPPPKSTGRELFSLDWLGEHLTGSHAPRDVQATLLEFTAEAIASAIERHANDAREIYLCGGGARNRRLVARIAERCGPGKVGFTDDLGVPAERVEAMAFAWLARRFALREPLDLGPITGASHPCILGALYPR